jgi:hypothetical protein
MTTERIDNMDTDDDRDDSANDLKHVDDTVLETHEED